MARLYGKNVDFITGYDLTEDLVNHSPEFPTPGMAAKVSNVTRKVESLRNPEVVMPRSVRISKATFNLDKVIYGFLYSSFGAVQLDFLEHE
jgi:hypothetical protein